MSRSLWEHFHILPDPRIERKKLHNLEDIVTITLCAIIAGCETWVDIALFGECKIEFFRTFLKLPHGIPSHDTFGRVFAALDPETFERCLRSWVEEIAGSSAGKHIAIDGKTIRRSMDRLSDKSAIHMVSAWVHENHAVFGQIKVDDKSNEISAIPKLIELLQLKGSTVTIDAIGCQKEIAQSILAKGGEYVLAVKGNQGSLHEDITMFMTDARERGFKGIEHDFFEQSEKGHGRMEKRRTWTTSEVEWLQRRHEWSGLKSIAMMECRRQIGDQVTTETRYFISSLPAQTAQRVGQVVRNHWRVENELHWSLDVCFGEDDCRARIGNAAENLSRVRRLALMLLKQDTKTKAGIKARRKKAGWDEHYLLSLFGF